MNGKLNSIAQRLIADTASEEDLERLEEIILREHDAASELTDYVELQYADHADSPADLLPALPALPALPSTPEQPGNPQSRRWIRALATAALFLAFAGIGVLIWKQGNSSNPVPLVRVTKVPQSSEGSYAIDPVKFDNWDESEGRSETAQVPEPSAALLFFTGAFLLAVRRSRQR